MSWRDVATLGTFVVKALVVVALVAWLFWEVVG